MGHFWSYRNLSVIVVYSIFALLIAEINITIATNEPMNHIKCTKHINSTLSDQKKFKELILNWWQKNNVPQPRQCDYKIKSPYKNEYMRSMTAPEIKTFPCHQNMTPPHYFFKGSIKNGYLEGKGRLWFMGDRDWKTFSNEKRKEIKEKNVCFATNHLVNNLRVQEIIGTFKNGSLHGTSRVILSDDSFFISSYKNGKSHGYHRSFSKKGTLFNAGLYEKGWEKGYHWKNVSNHLLYEDRSMVVDDIKPTLVFPFSDDGTLGDPIAGDYCPSGSLGNIKKIGITNITSTASFDCVLDIHYDLLDKVNYTYSPVSYTHLTLPTNREV